MTIDKPAYLLYWLLKNNALLPGVTHGLFFTVVFLPVLSKTRSSHEFGNIPMLDGYFIYPEGMQYAGRLCHSKSNQINFLGPNESNLAAYKALLLSNMDKIMSLQELSNWASCSFKYSPNWLYTLSY